MEKEIRELSLTRGGIYLAKLNLTKAAEIGKIRPVVVLTAQLILDLVPPILFVCPLSSKSYAQFEALHVSLPPRDSLEVSSFALVEHCRSISSQRVLFPRLGLLTPAEISLILYRLQKIIGITGGL